MAPVLFLVHGMGVHHTGWSDEVKEKLDEVAARYPSVDAFAGGKTFSQMVKCIEVTYDDIFVDYLGQFGATIEGINEAASGEGIELPGLLDWFTHHATPLEQEFFWNSCVDVVLYGLFKEIRTDVQVRVMASIAAEAKGSDEYSVLCHSLGTAVTHDSLARLGTEPWKGGKGFLAKGGFRFRNLFTVANVSRLVQLVTQSDVYASCVRPVSAGVPNYTEEFFQFSHKFDPFITPRPFAPENWGNGYHTVGPLTQFSRLNAHSWTHYLDNPSVHVPIINQMYGDIIIDDATFGQAVATYKPKLAPECAAKLDEIKMLTEFVQQQLVVSPTVETFAMVGSKLFAKIKEAGSACF